MNCTLAKPKTHFQQSQEDANELEMHVMPKKNDSQNLKNCLLSGPLMSELEVQFMVSPGQPLQIFERFQMSSVPWV